MSEPSKASDKQPKQPKQPKQKHKEQTVPTIPEREPKAPHKEVPSGMKVLSEGKANVLYEAARQRQVFYNPAMETNRDLSIAMVHVFIQLLQSESKKATKSRIPGEDHLQNRSRRGIRILEALSATGLRSIRYARELPADAVHSIVANDLDPAAVAAIRRNVDFNMLATELSSDVLADDQEQTTPPPVLPQHANANHCMNGATDYRYHVIDIDPYGTPSIFLNAALQAVTEGGLLCITATDMPVLCGKYPETCFAKYGATSLKGANCHEVALRVLLGCIERHATQFKRYVVPLVSLSVDYYVRVFVRVYTSASQVKSSASKLGYVLQCSDCTAHEIMPMMRAVTTTGKKGGVSTKFKLGSLPQTSTCEHCQGTCIQSVGPVWIDPLFDPDVLKSLMTHLHENQESYNSYSRLYGLLTAMSEELLSPLVYSVPRLAKILHVTTPPIATFKAAFLNAGHQITGTHTEPTAVKTNAPNEFVWDVMRAWVKEHPVKAQSATSPSTRLLSHEPKHTINFNVPDEMKSSIGSSRQKKKHNKDGFVPTFLPAPTANWGPKARATGFKRNREEEESANEEAAKQQKVAADSDPTKESGDNMADN